MSGHSLGSRVPVCVMAALEDMCLTTNSPMLPPFRFLLLNVISHSKEYLLNVGQLLRLCALPSSWTGTALQREGEVGEKALLLCELLSNSHSTGALSVWCYHNCMSRVNSIPARSMALKGNCWIWKFLLPRFHFLFPVSTAMLVISL